MLKSEYDKLVARRDALLAQLNAIIAQANLAEIPAGLEMKSAHEPVEPPTPLPAGASRTWGGMVTPEETAKVAGQQESVRSGIMESLDDLTRGETAESMKGGALASALGDDVAAATANVLKAPFSMARGAGEQIGGVVKAIREGKLADAGYQLSTATAGLVPFVISAKYLTTLLPDEVAEAIVPGGIKEKQKNQEELKGNEFLPVLDMLGLGGFLKTLGVGKPTTGAAFIESGAKPTSPQFKVDNVETSSYGRRPVGRDIPAGKGEAAPFKVTDVTTPLTPQFPDYANTIKRGKNYEPMFPPGTEPDFSKADAAKARRDAFRVKDVKNQYTPVFPDYKNTIKRGNTYEPLFSEESKPKFPEQPPRDVTSEIYEGEQAVERVSTGLPSARQKGTPQEMANLRGETATENQTLMGQQKDLKKIPTAHERSQARKAVDRTFAKDKNAGGYTLDGRTMNDFDGPDGYLLTVKSENFDGTKRVLTPEELMTLRDKYGVVFEQVDNSSLGTYRFDDGVGASADINFLFPHTETGLKMAKKLNKELGPNGGNQSIGERVNKQYVNSIPAGGDGVLYHLEPDHILRLWEDYKNKGNETIDLRRYAPTEGLAKLTPGDEKVMTKVGGREDARIAEGGAPSGLHYYIGDQPVEGTVKQVAPNEYKVTGHPRAKLYDRDLDLDDIFSKHKNDPNAAEQAVIDAGFDGYYSERNKIAKVYAELTPDAPTVAKSATVETPVTPKPKTSQPLGDKNTASIRKADIAATFKEFKFDKLDEVQRKGWEESLNEAMDQGLQEKAIDIAEAAADEGRPMTDAENAGAVLKIRQLKADIKAARKAGEEAAKSGNDAGVVQSMTTTMNLMEELHRLGVATDKSGTATGRGLSIRRMMAEVDTFDEAHIMQIKRAAKGKPLTKEEIAASGEQAKRYAELQKENARLVEAEDAATIEAERKGAEATIAVSEWRKGLSEKSAKSKEAILKERAEIKKAIVGLGYKVNDVIPASGEVLYQVGRLAVNYIKEGAVSLDEVARLVMADVPGLTKYDVYAALNAKNPKAKARAKTIVEQRVSNLKKQARLLAEIEDVSNGITKPKTPRPAGEMPSEIKALQTKLADLRTEAYRGALETKKAERAIHLINKLQDQLDNHYREVRAAKKSGAPSPKLESLNDRIAEIKKTMRSEDTLADLNEQLRTGEFKIEHRPAKKVSPELEKNQIEINRLRKQIRQEAEAMKPKSVGGKVVEGVLMSRSLMASGDISATFRQAFWLSARRPLSAMRAQGKALKAMFSQLEADKFENVIQQDPRWIEYQKAKLEFSDLDGAVSAREEYFRSNLTEKLPWVRGSNRHMTTMMNYMRKDAFDQFLEAYPEATQAQKIAWADYVNVASGRGKMALTPSMMNKANAIFFAPKFAVSRFQTPTRLFKNLKDPIVRKEIAKEYAAVGGVVLTTMALAKMAGADVSLDPRDPRFGRIRLGDTSVDILGGVLQPMRLVSRTILGVTDHWGATGGDLSDEYKRVDLKDVYGQFAAVKLSPLITVPYGLGVGENVVGEKVSPLQVGAEAVFPLLLTDIYQASKHGAGPAAASALGNLTGMGVSTFPDSERVTRAKLRALKLKKDLEGYKRKELEWNKRNPKNRIETVDIKP